MNSTPPARVRLRAVHLRSLTPPPAAPLLAGICVAALAIAATGACAQTDEPETNVAPATVLRVRIRTAQEEFVRTVSGAVGVDERIIWVTLPAGTSTNNLAACLFPALERARGATLTAPEKDEIARAEERRAKRIASAWQDHIEDTAKRRP